MGISQVVTLFIEQMIPLSSTLLLVLVPKSNHIKADEASRHAHQRKGGPEACPVEWSRFRLEHERCNESTTVAQADFHTYGEGCLVGSRDIVQKQNPSSGQSGE